MTDRPVKRPIFGTIDWPMAIAQSVAVMLSCMIGAYATGPFHDESRYFGAMLAAIAAIVALQTDLKTSEKQGLLRVFGTFVGALIAYVYLLLFPVTLTGVVVAVFVLEVLCMAIRIPNSGRMATITLVVVLLISERYPDLPPWMNGLLRFFETTVGALIGVTSAWVLDWWARRRTTGEKNLL